MQTCNKKTPWVTGVHTKALYGFTAHSTQAGHCAFIVVGGRGLLFAAPGWEEPGNDPTKNEPQHGQHQRCANAIHCGACYVGHLLLSGRGANNDIPHLAKVITWRYFTQVNAAIRWVSFGPTSERSPCNNEKGQCDVETFDAFKDVHASKCSTRGRDLARSQSLPNWSASRYTVGRPKGSVCRNTKPAEVAAPTYKRGFVMPKFLELMHPFASLFMISGGMGISVKTAARLLACYEHPTHPLPVVRQTVVSLSRSGVQTMTAITQQASHRAAQPQPTTGEAALIQLHADAHNALNMAVYYLRQPQPNTAAARRKAIQALAALRGLSLSLEG